MYNKKSASAATKYTKGVFTESGPKSKMASKNGEDDPKKPKASASDTTGRSYTMKPETSEPKTTREVDEMYKAGKLDSKGRTAAKLKILGPKQFKKQYGYLPEGTEKKTATYERPEYVPGRKESTKNRTFLAKEMPAKEASEKRRQVIKEARMGLRTREEKKAGLDSTWTEKGLRKAERKAVVEGKIRRVKNKVKKVCDKIDKATGLNKCHWVGQF